MKQGPQIWHSIRPIKSYFKQHYIKDWDKTDVPITPESNTLIAVETSYKFESALSLVSITITIWVK